MVTPGEKKKSRLPHPGPNQERRQPASMAQVNGPGSAYFFGSDLES